MFNTNKIYMDFVHICMYMIWACMKYQCIWCVSKHTFTYKRQSAHKWNVNLTRNNVKRRHKILYKCQRFVLILTILCICKIRSYELLWITILPEFNERNVLYKSKNTNKIYGKCKTIKIL